MAALVSQFQAKRPVPRALDACPHLLVLGLPCADLAAGMGMLTSDEDFGEGGGLAIGILHQHRVGGCVLNGASEKERRTPPPPR